LFTETTAYDLIRLIQHQSLDHFVRATEKLMVCHMFLLIVQQLWTFSFPEKLIPLFINNIIQNKPLPVYGDSIPVIGYLEDHAVAIDLVFIKG
jgi:dTDP-glucose 4,6-dehydratase